jgi:hypothetical protein
MQQIVFNGHYLMYFDTAVAGYWRAGLALPRAPWQRCRATSTCARPRWSTTARRATTTCWSRHALRAHRQLVDGAAGGGVPRRRAAGAAASWSMSLPTRPRRPASPCRRPARPVVHAFEAGAPMVTVQVGDWADAGPRSRAPSARRCSSTSRRFRPSWSGTRRRPLRACGGPQPPGHGRWPPAACWRTSARRGQDRPHGGAGQPCAAAASAARCWMR